MHPRLPDAAMPTLHPIKAVRYACSNGGDISTRIAPPYDVLDEGPKRQLLAVDDRNIVAVDLPVTPPKTVGPEQAYRDAGQRYRTWLGEGTLRYDPTASVFAYEQVYTLQGQTYRRRGLLAGLGVEPFGRAGGGIHRHELTFKSGTDDRLLLMNATEAQLSPIFGMFDDPDGRVMRRLAEVFDSRPPDFHGRTANDNVEHRCWIISDRAVIAELAATFETADVFIADGHHRYTTALNYLQQHPDEPEAGVCLFVLVPVQDAGMIVLPTHRVVCNMTGFTVAALQSAVSQDGWFKLEPTDHGGDGLPTLAEELPSYGPHAMGLYDPAKGRSYCLTTTSDDPLAAVMPDKPRVWRMLDVAVLHELFIDRTLRPRFGGEAITNTYPHQLTQLVRQSHDQPGRLGVIMQPTPLEAVCQVSRAGQVMPQKSTFFYPKLATGLVIHPLR